MKYGVDVASGNQKVIDEASAEEITDYSFSPNREWVAYSKTAPNYQSSLWVYNLISGEKRQLTVPPPMETRSSVAMASTS